ncbi:nickel ABC transporter permease [Natrarchaeobius chitinivorans]|uniref:ABC transporter permease n=1 Tax=Natrarchaeobius chitinivorans TaxID=1679083 RepID=A0A3N6M209_NATCH|nr:nickel ABC transporter permease [Natrarchaeobius chitinivorans]RQG95787.1 ABC transporter permease [Natrarchaeobius chitinivorans]
MYRYLLKRFASSVVVLGAVSLVTYALVTVAPGDPAETILREQLHSQPSDEQVAQFRAEHGLDEPFHVQYVSWLGDAVTGDLGQSYFHGRTVHELIAAHLPATIELAVAATVVAVAISVPAGIASAVYRRTPLDYVSQAGALFGVSVPNFWLGYLLILVIAVPFSAVPTSGAGSVTQLVLPAVTLGTGLAAVITRLLRASLLETLEEPYVRTARSKGLRERVVICRHALRSALIPVVTVVGLQFAYVLNGAVIVEVVFDRPGLGSLLVDAVFARDFPVVQGVVMVTAVLFVVTNLLVDLSYRYLDPRIDLEASA